MLSIRPVTAADVPAVVALITRTLAEFNLQFGVGTPTDDPIRSLPSSYTDAGGAFWVAASDHIVGTCGLYPVDPGIYELRKMYLDPAARGTGIAVRLLDTAVDFARAQGATAIVLDTLDSMTRAIAFYEAHGFTRDDTQIRGTRCSRGYIRRL
ncbi:MAG: GNAT family N-acetyltransferase [Deltaproteobacteria bacterium]|nr:GNAT family N-acetyltransferase [Deltaproteobacteria bacterium]